MSDNVELAVGLVAIFLAVALLLGTVGVFTAERQQVTRSLAAIRMLNSVPAHMRRDLDKPFNERVVGPAMDRLTRLGRRWTPVGKLEALRRKLELAGNPPRWDVDRVLAFKMLGLFVLPVVAVLLCVAASRSTGFTLVVALAAVGLGYYVPDITLYQIAAKRTDRMRKELPDALDLLTISVEAGLGFDAALAQVARNTQGPLADEFFRVLQEMQIGLGRLEAIRALGERTNLEDLKQFTTAMVQADAFGVPIANVLRVQSKEMRIKRSQRAEEAAQKVPVKILFPLIFCIMPSLFIVILGPSIINIYHNLLGH